MYEKLLSPCKIGKLEIRNRTVQEPMGNGFSNADGIATAKDIAFYTRRAAGGVGLVITECMNVQPGQGAGNDKQMTMSVDSVIDSMRDLVAHVHAMGAAIMPELYHSGCQGAAAMDPQGACASPSGIESQLTHEPAREITLEEIKQLEKDFISASVRAQKCGFDGIELHCAHGYLLNEFFSPYTNKRTDEYGGSTENRVRIVKNIVEGIRAELGEDFPIVCRVSVDEMLKLNGIDDGIVLEEGIEICKLLESYGVDAIDVSSGIYETMNIAWEPTGYEQGWKSYLAAGVKANVSITVFCTSVIRDPAFAEKLLQDGVCDFVGSARQFFSDPDWTNKAAEGRTDEIRKCISCLNCMLTMESPEGSQCSINPCTGSEHIYTSLKADGAGRTVVIVGAGPAGLEAALTLANRGFAPVVIERKSEIGGQLQLANKTPNKDEIDYLIGFYKVSFEKLGIEVRLNTVATPELIASFEPYAVIWAAGSVPVVPRSIPGLDSECVLLTPEVLSGKVKLFGKKVCIVGSGMTGIETAHMLAKMGNKVDVYEMVDEVMPGMWFQNIIAMMEHIMPLGVGLHPSRKLIEVGEGFANFEDTHSGEIEKAEFDYLVLSLGTRATLPDEAIQAAYPNLIVVGDSEKPGKIAHAVRTGFDAAFALE
ncbi:MAG: FAD-dependent oxidoreductase [Coriobacteriales bacterium]|nr:FAD-dependent oxidoreductase [Coriobacteriales bacterium]